MTDLPQRIRDYRTAKSLTANEFGRLVGSDRQNVYGWERRVNPTTPSPPVLFRLADPDVAIITVEERDQLIRGVAA